MGPQRIVWTVQIPRKPGQILGIKGIETPMGVEITEITKDESSMVADWNKRHPKEPLTPGDRIIAVEGNKTDILKHIQDQRTKLSEAKYVEMIISHLAPPDLTNR